MFNVTKQAHKFAKFGYLINGNQKTLNIIKPYACFVHYCSNVKFFGNVQNRDLFLTNDQFRIILLREKSKRTNLSSRKRHIEEDDTDDDDDDDEEEENEEDEFVEEGAIVKTYNLVSTRTDLILKNILKQKRKKIEELFYNNKIRVNGKVLFKKAENREVGDEIDLIKGISKKNSDLLEVSRVEILKVKFDEDTERFLIKAKSYKNLEIDNYPEGDAWKDPEAGVEDLEK